jgi:hypothetical protein
MQKLIAIAMAAMFAASFGAIAADDKKADAKKDDKKAEAKKDDKKK